MLKIQKRAKDNKNYVKPHSIKIGDTVLLSQKKTKMHPPYDPNPYIVVEVRGHQITATRGEKTITRDAQKWKIFWKRSKPNYEELRQKLQDSSSSSDDEMDFSEFHKKPTTNDGNSLDTIDAGVTEESLLIDEPVTQPRRNPTRNRQPPSRFR